MKTVTIIDDAFNPAQARHFTGVVSVRQTIMDAFPAWPANARIYDGAVALVRDVTPCTACEVAALEELDNDHVIVVVYPDGPVALIIAAVAIVALSVALVLLIPTVPTLSNRQFDGNSGQLTERKNAPRPNGRIPDIYGQLRVAPDLIAVPYTVFIANQEIEVAYMCIGRGEFEISDVRDDATLVSTIEGASVEIYGPGTSPNSGAPVQTIGSAIGRDVLTAKRITSVNGQVLEPGEWVGPFSIQLRGLDRVYVNVVAVQGMFKDNGEDQFSTTVSFELEVTPLDDSGFASGAPVTITGTVTGSATNRDIKGVTTTANVTAPSGRVSVRVRRTTPKDTAFEGTVVDEIKWRDLYGMAPVDKDDFGDITTVMAQTYATAGALALKERKLNMLVTRKLPSRDTGTGDYAFTTALTATKSAADILCAMALDPVIGRLPGGELVSDGGAGQVDVPQIYDEVAAVVTYFGIEDAGEFAYAFTRSDTSFQEMAQAVANAAFCQVYRRGSILRLRLEKPQPDSRLLLNHRNKVPRTETRTYTFGTAAGYDGVALTYIDPSDDAPVTLYVPQGDDTAANALEVDGIGMRSFEQAYLHAWRNWNRLKYRYITEQFGALQEADMLVRMDRFLSVDTTRADVLDGEVLAQDGLVLTLSQAAVLDPAETYTCFLQLSTGVVEAIAVTPGADPYHVVLAEAPTNPLTVSDDAAYRTGYLIVQDGDGKQVGTPMLLFEKDPAENFTVGVKAINYDVRYYANDLDFLSEGAGPGTDPDEPEVVDGEPDPAVTVSITPPYRNTQSNGTSSTGLFTVNVTGGAPSAYFWGVQTGDGVVFAGQGTNAAQLRVFDFEGFGGFAQFYCDVVIAGVTYRAFCTSQHTYLGDTVYDRYDRR
jgi:hypothetical protein